MGNDRLTTRTIKGKYQITKNIYVACYLNILEATDQEIRTFLKLKSTTHAQVPIGTKIIFDAETLQKPQVGASPVFDIFSITVKKIEDLNGAPLHVCTPIHKETRPDLRAIERKPVDFPIQLNNSTSIFRACNASVQGLTFIYATNRAMVSLALDRPYQFLMHHKGENYDLPGQIKHIQYDWKSHQHTLGVEFSKLSSEVEIILSLIMDPEYTIKIANNQTVDTSSGKISAED